MKKVRIMLAAMIVLGSVGGALAFKAKTFGGKAYCITRTDVFDPKEPVTCPLSTQAASFDALGATVYAYYLTTAPQLCTQAPDCTSIGKVNN